jgi:hypothetical protein
MHEQFHYNTSLEVLSHQFYRIHPAVYGWLGEGCVPEANNQVISYQKLHYVFVAYPIDCICRSLGAYIAKENLIDKLLLMRATGIGFDQVQLSLSDDSECLSLTDFVMPRFRWLRIYGQAGRDDFGLAAESHNSLVVSHRVRRAMLESGLEDSGCIPYSSMYHGQVAQTIFAT